MPCVGRPFEIGMPYDTKSDELILNLMWNADAIQKNLQTEQRFDTLFEVVVGDSFVEKALKLNIPPELQLSIVAGLVKLSGSACYLTDYIHSNNLARVVLRCSAISKSDHLALAENLALFQVEQVTDNNAATHVVTSIQYGCELYIVFEYPINKGEKAQTVEANLLSKVKQLAKVCNGSDDIAVDGS